MYFQDINSSLATNEHIVYVVLNYSFKSSNYIKDSICCMKVITKRVIECAYTVYNTLGTGFLESVYHNAMIIELGKKGLQVESEVSMAVLYKEHVVGNFKADLLIEQKVIVELKAIDAIARVHEIQLVNYLASCNKDVGLLINFGPNGVTVKRREKESPSKIHIMAMPSANVNKKVKTD